MALKRGDWKRWEIRIGEHKKTSDDGKNSKDSCKHFGREWLPCMQRECFLKGILDARYFYILDTLSSAGLWQVCKNPACLFTFSILFGRYYFLQLPLNLHSAAQMFHQASQPSFVSLTAGRDGDCPHMSFKEHIKQTATQSSTGKADAATRVRTWHKAPSFRIFSYKDLGKHSRRIMPTRQAALTPVGAPGLKQSDHNGRQLQCACPTR